MKTLILLMILSSLMSCEKGPIDDDPSFGWTDSAGKANIYPFIVIQEPTTQDVPAQFNLSVTAWDKSQIDSIIMKVDGRISRVWVPTASTKEWNYSEYMDISYWGTRYIHFRVVNNKRLSSETSVIVSMITF